ncbi:hypothetical protein ACP4OV_004928 [Aristida adscensionis]
MAARRLLTPGAAPPPATPAAAGPPQAQWSMHGSAVKAAVAGNVVFALLFFAAVMWRIFFWGRGGGQEGAAVAPVGVGGAAVARASSSSGLSTPCESPRARGLGKEDLLALPVFVHGASSPAEGDAGGERSKVECAVCISELRDGDTGRLLPRCGHRFHAECVDRWFRSHVTCPLCRAVVADGGSDQPDPKAPPAVV